MFGFKVWIKYSVLQTFSSIVNILTRSEGDSSEYAKIMGNAFEDYAEFGMYNYTNNSLATTNKHKGLEPAKSVFSSNYNQATQTFENRVESGKIEFKQLSQDEIGHMKTVSKPYADQKGISQDEAYNRLYDSAMYAIDEESRNNRAPLTKQQLDQGFMSLTKETQEEINEDIAYLKITSKGKRILDVYDEDNRRVQDMFTATPEQLNNANYNPDHSRGMEMTIPFFPPVTAISKTIGLIHTTGRVMLPKVNRVVMDASIRTHQVATSASARVNNAVQSRVIPTLQRTYYKSANRYLENSNTYIQGGVDFIESALPGVPSASKVGYGTLIGSKIYDKSVEALSPETTNEK